MRLIDELERSIARQQSPFQAQLLREDVARLRKLQALAAASERDAFLKAGMRIGWTQGDARTQELRRELEPFLEAFHAGDQDRIVERWNALHRARMERLLGCLATPVPRPSD